MSISANDPKLKDEKTTIRESFFDPVEGVGFRLYDALSECYMIAKSNLMHLFSGDERYVHQNISSMTNQLLASRWSTYFPHSTWQQCPNEYFTCLNEIKTNTEIRLRSVAPGAGGTPSGGRTMRARARYHQGAGKTAEEMNKLPRTLFDVPDLTGTSLILVYDLSNLEKDRLYVCKPTDAGQFGKQIPTAYSFPIPYPGEKQSEFGSFIPDVSNQNILTDLLEDPVTSETM